MLAVTGITINAIRKRKQKQPTQAIANIHIMTRKKRSLMRLFATTLKANCMEYLSGGITMEHPNTSVITKMVKGMGQLSGGMTMEHPNTSGITKMTNSMEYLSGGMTMEHPDTRTITKMANCMEYVRRGMAENSYASAITKRVNV
jgi:hypothetical protein